MATAIRLLTPGVDFCAYPGPALAPAVPAPAKPTDDDADVVRNPPAVVRERSPRAHLLVLRFALLNLVATALLGAAWAQGLVARVLEADRTHLCVVISLVFLVGLGICAARVWRTSRELEAASRADAHLDGALGELLAPIRRCGPDRRGSLFGALRMRLSQRITVVRHIAGNLVLLGLVGTVVGFIVALSGVDPTKAGDVTSVAPMVAGLIAGMSTALYTTLVGSLLNLWLMANYQLLASGTVQLVATLAERIEGDA